MWRNVDGTGGGEWEDKLLPVETIWLLGDKPYISDFYDRPATADEINAGNTLWAAHLLTATVVIRPPHSVRKRFMYDKHAAVNMPIRSEGVGPANQLPPATEGKEAPPAPTGLAVSGLSSPMFHRAGTQKLLTGEDVPNDQDANRSRPVMNDSNTIYNDLHVNAKASMSTQMMFNALALQTEKTTRERADKILEQERVKAAQAMEKEKDKHAEETRQMRLREMAQNDEYRSTPFPCAPTPNARKQK